MVFLFLNVTLETNDKAQVPPYWRHWCNFSGDNFFWFSLFPQVTLLVSNSNIEQNRNKTIQKEDVRSSSWELQTNYFYEYIQIGAYCVLNVTIQLSINLSTFSLINHPLSSVISTPFLCFLLPSLSSHNFS